MNKTFGCLFLIALILNLTIGTWSVIQILSWFGKSIPLIGNVIVGLVIGEVSIPIAIVGYVLRCFGIF